MRAVPKLGSNSGCLKGDQRKRWRLRKSPEKIGFHHCGLEKTELGIERDFMEKLGARWKKSLKI